jgi:arylformamidase
VHAFFHGGAWRALSKRESAFFAPAVVAAGAHFAAVDFGLAPAATLAEMVAQARRAVAWLYRNAARFGGDPSRLCVSGHSSGAHLAACVLTTDWARDFGLPADVVKAGVCVSGIYELLPVRLSSRNRYLGLDAALEQALSPLRHLDRLACPVVVGAGGLESDEFRRQSREFAAALQRAGRLEAQIVEPRLNHFETAETLADAGSRLGGALIAQLAAR